MHKESKFLSDNISKVKTYNVDRNLLDSLYYDIPHTFTSYHHNIDYGRLLNQNKDKSIQTIYSLYPYIPTGAFLEFQFGDTPKDIVHLFLYGTSVNWRGESYGTPKIYSQTDTALEKMIEYLQGFIHEDKDLDKTKPNFFVICQGNGGLYSEKIHFPSIELKEEEKSLMYGDKFIKWEKTKLSEALSKNRGLYILRGEPGTGKTSIIKSWISEFKKTHDFYYIPISMFEILYSPQSIRFWISLFETDEDEIEENMSIGADGTFVEPIKKKKVIIIEDAENIIAKRDGSNQSEISNLLNMSDGLLGEAIACHIIMTVNCEMEDIDRAVLRRGRLSGMWQFGRRSKDEAIEIAKRKNLDVEAVQAYNKSSLTLAEIFNATSDTLGQYIEHESIGFKS